LVGGMNGSMCSSLLGVLIVFFFLVLYWQWAFVIMKCRLMGRPGVLCGIPLSHPFGLASWTSSLATVGEDLDG
jgi:hypothetical protein